MKSNTAISHACSNPRVRFLALAMGVGASVGTALGDVAVGCGVGIAIWVALGLTHR